MRLTSRLRLACLLVIAVVCCLWLFLYVESVHQRRKAERFVSDLTSLPLSNAGFSQVREFAYRHGGTTTQSGPETPQALCRPDVCDFDISMEPVGTKVLRSQEHLLRVLHGLVIHSGISVWNVSATFAVRHGSLEHTNVFIGQYRGDDVIVYQVDLDRVRTPFSDGNYPGSDYVVTRPHVTGPPADVLHVWALQRTGSSWGRAFDVHLDCLTKLWQGCSDFRQLAPSAWSDYDLTRKSFQSAQRGASEH